MIGVVSAVIPILFSIVKFFVNRSNLSDKEKQAFLKNIRAADRIVKRAVALRTDAKDNRKKLRDKYKNGGNNK